VKIALEGVDQGGIDCGLVARRRLWIGHAVPSL
jgi:hypothetical protein